VKNCSGRSESGHYSFYILGAGKTPAPQPGATTANFVVQDSSLQKVRSENGHYTRDLQLFAFEAHRRGSVFSKLPEDRRRLAGKRRVDSK